MLNHQPILPATILPQCQPRSRCRLATLLEFLHQCRHLDSGAQQLQQGSSSQYVRVSGRGDWCSSTSLRWLMTRINRRISMDADLAACRPLAATAEERWRNGYGDRGRECLTCWSSDVAVHVCVTPVDMRKQRFSRVASTRRRRRDRAARARPGRYPRLASPHATCDGRERVGGASAVRGSGGPRGRSHVRRRQD